MIVDTAVSFVRHSFLDLRQERKQTVVAISVAIAFATLALFRHKSKENSRGCATIPYKIPIIGSTADYMKDPKGFTQKWTEKLGPVYRVHLFGELSTVVSGPFVREVLLNDDFKFAIDERFDMRLLADLLPESSIPVEDVRKLTITYLTANVPRYADRVTKVMVAAAAHFLGDLREPKTLPSAFPLIQELVSKASAAVFVGEETANDDLLVRSFKIMVSDIGKELTQRPWIMLFPRLNRIRMWYVGKHSKVVELHKNHLRAALAPEVERRLKAMESSDYTRPMDVLQDILDHFPCPENVDRNTYFTDWMCMLIFAAIHTTSLNATVVLYRILQHTETLKELMEEQKQVFGDGPINSDGLAKLVKMDSFCRESLRLRSDYLSNLPHRFHGKKEISFSNGILVKPGDLIYINMWANHRQRERTLTESFEPFRFVGINRKASKIDDNYLIFGMGKHACPGRWFALNEVKTCLSLILQNYRVTPTQPVVMPNSDIQKFPAIPVTIEKL